jgi:hypothetical protein
MRDLKSGECVAMLERGPLDGKAFVAHLIDDEPPHGIVVEQCSDAACEHVAQRHTYSLDAERAVLEADGTEIYFYRFAFTSDLS